MRDLAIALGCGALHALPAAWPSLWPLQPLAVGALAWIVARATARRAFFIGSAFAAAWLAAGVWWLFISMHRYGGMPAWLAALAVALLALALGAYLGTALALFAAARRGTPAADAVLFAACWLAAELARAVLFTGFPWVASGYAHVDSPLARLAPWLGVYGIGCLAALLAALVAFGLRARGSRRAALAVLAALLIGAAGLAWVGRDGFTRPAGTIGVTLLQPNVAQNMKFEPEHVPATLRWLGTHLSAARGPLVVAPETAIPLLPDRLDPTWWKSVTAPFDGVRRAALIGAPLGSFSRGYTNSALGFAGPVPYRYDKHHLVPFGEFVPPGFRWFVDMMNIPLGDFSRGPKQAKSFDAFGQLIAPNICYEDLFGEELAARFRDDSIAPTLFANLSNIGWFGDTIAVAQHVQISRMRSLEFERAMLRATNTGATAIIDHRGRVTAQLPSFTRGALDGQVQGRVGSTPYARWTSRFGLTPLAVFAVAVVAVAALMRASSSRSDRRESRS